MSDERIEIKIEDKVASSIETKLDGITAAARSGYDAVERIQKALARLDGGALNALSLANSRAQKAMNDSALSAARLATEQQRTVAVANAAALTQGKLATELQKTGAASMQAEAAISKAITAQNQANESAARLTTAQQRIQTETTKTATAQQQLAAAATRAATAQTQGVTAAQRLATEQQRTAIQTANAAAASDRAALAALRLQNAQNRQAQASIGAANGLMMYVRSATAVLGVGLTAQGVLGLGDAYTTLQNKLQVVSQTQEQVATLTERLFDIANKTRAPVEETATAYSRFDRALEQLGRSQEESLRLTETVNKMLIVSGSTATEAGAALLQLSQAFNKGKLDGDEFRTVMELMPDAADAIAKELGVTRGELLKLAPEGKITAEVLANAFAAASDDIDAKFGKTVPTLGQSMAVLRNNAIETFGEFNKATGITAGLSAMIIGLANNMDVLMVILTTIGTGLLVYFGPALLAALTTATRAVWAFTAAIATNPIGLLVVALAGVITYFKMFHKEMDIVAIAIDKIAFALDGVAGFLRGFAIFAGSAIAQVVGSVKSVIIDSYNAVVTFIQDTINVAIKAANFLREKVGMTAYDFVEFEKIKTQGETEFEGFGKLWADSLEQGFKEQSQGGIQELVKRMRGAGVPEGETGGGLRGPTTPQTPTEPDKAAAKRAEAMRRVNAELDAEMNRLFELEPLRATQAEFDKIELDLLKKKIVLSDSEADSIRGKIEALNKAAVVQQKFDDIYEASVGPSRDYNATLDAAGKLLAKNAISQQFYNQTVAKAKETYLNQLDPLRQVNKELDDQNKLLALLPRQREIDQQVQQISNQLLAEGKTFAEGAEAALRARLKAQQDLNIASQAEASVWESTRGAREKYLADLDAIAKLKAAGTITGGEAAQQVMDANPQFDFTNTQTETDARVQYYNDMYTRIDDLRKKDLINEETAAALRMRVWAESQAAQLEGASDFFGQMSQLQKSENSKVAAIGKAAAIAKAIIDTYTAATGAYASLASIPYVGPALGAAAAAAAITAGMANVQAIRSQSTGFQAGGYTGDIPRNAVAGPVHGQEYVMDANSTQRIGVDNLDAMRRGAAGVSTQTGTAAKQAPVIVPPAQVRQKFVTVLDPSIVGQFMDSEEGEEVTLNIIERNPSRISSAVNGT